MTDGIPFEDLCHAVRGRIESLIGDLENEDARSLAHAPLSEDAVRAAETRLGFAPPPALRALYLGVANGGFGPSYGLLGLVGGMRQEDGCDAVSLYESFRKPLPTDPHWAWPEGLLPVVHLGCAVFYCVDTATPDGMVTWWEPNPHMSGTPYDDCFVPLGRTDED